MLPCRYLIIVFATGMFASCTKQDSVTPKANVATHSSSTTDTVVVAVPAYPHTDTFYGSYLGNSSVAGTFDAVYILYTSADSLTIYTNSFTNYNIAFTTNTTDTNSLKTAFYFGNNWNNDPDYPSTYAFTLGTIATTDSGAYPAMTPKTPMLTCTYSIANGGCDHGPRGTYYGYKLNYKP